MNFSRSLHLHFFARFFEPSSCSLSRYTRPCLVTLIHLTAIRFLSVEGRRRIDGGKTQLLDRSNIYRTKPALRIPRQIERAVDFGKDWLQVLQLVVVRGTALLFQMR